MVEDNRIVVVKGAGRNRKEKVGDQMDAQPRSGSEEKQRHKREKLGKWMVKDNKLFVVKRGSRQRIEKVGK